MNNNDKERLRFLAARQMEVANSPKNLDRVELWKRHHAMKGERPLIHIEIDTFAHEVIEPLLKGSAFRTAFSYFTENLSYQWQAVLQG